MESASHCTGRSITAFAHTHTHRRHSTPHHQAHLHNSIRVCVEESEKDGQISEETVRLRRVLFALFELTVLCCGGKWSKANEPTLRPLSFCIHLLCWLCAQSIMMRLLESIALLYALLLFY